MPPLLWAAVRFEFKGAAVTLDPPRSDHGDIHDIRRQPVCRRSRVAEAKADHAAAFSGHLGIVGAHRRGHIPAASVGAAHIAPKRGSLRKLVDVVPVAISRLAPDGEPTFLNKRLTDFLGLDAADRNNPSMSRLMTAVHPEDAVGLDKARIHSLATGEPFSMKYRLRRADGVYRWVEGRAEPLRDQDGTIIEWYAVSLDIDDEVRAQEALRDSERELSQLVDMVPSHLWRLTPDGEPTFFNKRMVDFLGLDVADTDKARHEPTGGGNRDRSIRMTQRSLAAALNRCLVTGERFTMRYRLRRADGVYRWMSSSAEPMRDRDGQHRPVVWPLS